jgi:hypothetical protein
VAEHAEQGNPASVLATIDRFARGIGILTGLFSSADK